MFPKATSLSIMSLHTKNLRINNWLLFLKQLSLKLAMLFCLERVSALRKLDLAHCRILPEGMEFVLSATYKWGSSDQLTTAFFARFPSSYRLQLVETSGLYLKATRAIRPVFPSFKVDLLFISYVRPHKPIMAPSIKRWLCLLLRVFGVDTKNSEQQHTAHSCTAHSVWSLSCCSSQFQCSLIRDFKDGLLVYSFNFSKVLFQTGLKLNVCSCSSSMSLFSAVSSS